MLYTKLQGHQPVGFGNFKGFYHIWEWWPSWSYDQVYLYKHLFPCRKEAPS